MTDGFVPLVLVGAKAPDGFVFISSRPRLDPDQPETRKYHREMHGFRFPINSRMVTKEMAEELGFRCCSLKCCLGPEELRAYEDRESRRREQRQVEWDRRREIEIEAGQRGRLEANRHRLVAVDDMRWVCSCGARGRKRWQSEAVAATEWIRHILRLAGVMQPRYYQDWMHRSVAEDFGDRLADLQRDLGTIAFPVVGEYPWTLIEPPQRESPSSSFRDGAG